MTSYRVLVVDDSAFMRQIISDLITKDGQFIIAGTAVNGMEAVNAALKHKPDVITMDLEMPEMNGIEALRLIMQTSPAPVIMLSGISENNTRDTIKALQYGAFDFIRKPSVSGSGDDISQVGIVLLEKLKAAVLASKSKSVQLLEQQSSKQETAAADERQQAEKDQKPATGRSETRLQPKPASLHIPKREKKAESPQLRPGEFKLSQPPKQSSRLVDATRSERVQKPINPSESAGKAEQKTAAKASAGSSAPEGKKRVGGSFKHFVAIGTSTGGPRALNEVICSLPADFPAPVFVVQHMPPKFTRSLAQRLDSFSALHVVEAEQNMEVRAGFVYIAPGGFHLELAKKSGSYFVKLTDSPQRNGHRPSVDVMFESVAEFPELSRHAVVMTGMGSDGAKGLKLLSEGGAVSLIAESEETCIVYGMPRAAFESGYVKTVLPLHAIAKELTEAVLQQ
ncbi:chemotaxis response regulator protein-glutamate methylesterase [Paenibacillus sp. HB172176]|uniref:protein-glutamate methylesterase/protein-glutamine glutaminase n=1 Tax=Paenibacillus sp. HB172176 TaxID=2493690 RepID=UPI00143A68C2|nr:chemotaxis response regulator protein-glutamate methylesterase [Paenibacillus sp. HB172176]